MKGKFVYSIILFAGLLFAGSDFLYAQTQSGSGQQKSHSGKKHYKSTKKNQGNVNEMRDTTKNYQYKSSEGKDYRDMQDNQIQDTSKWRNQDRFKGMSDSARINQYPQRDQRDKGGIKQGDYQNQGDYSNPDDLNRDYEGPEGIQRQSDEGPEGIQRQGDFQNEGDIQYEDGYSPMKDTSKIHKDYDHKSKDWKSKDWNNDKDMRLEKNKDLKKKNR